MQYTVPSSLDIYVIYFTTITCIYYSYFRYENTEVWGSKKIIQALTISK